MTRPFRQILSAATVCVLLLPACGGESAESIAAWTCERVRGGQDPNAVIDAMTIEQRESGVSDRAMAWALWDGCGVELGLEPPPGPRP